MKELIEYVRQRKHGRNEKVGVLVGSSENGDPINIGWSKVMLRQEGEAKDTFDKTRGLQIARGRLMSNRYSQVKPPKLPHIIRKKLPKFQERCLKYFKGAELGTIPS